MASIYATSVRIPSFIVVFINLCEAYLGIFPHFDLFHHFFYLKMRGGARSKVVGNANLQLQDRIVSQYIIVQLNMNLKYWACRWFYIRQVEPYVQCNID